MFPKDFYFYGTGSQHNKSKSNMTLSHLPLLHDTHDARGLPMFMFAFTPICCLLRV